MQGRFSPVPQIRHCPWSLFAARVATGSLSARRILSLGALGALTRVALGEPDRSQDRAHCLQVPGFVGFQRWRARRPFNLQPR